MNYTYLDSPLGRILLAGDEGGLRHISFGTEDSQVLLEADWVESAEALAEAMASVSG